MKDELSKIEISRGIWRGFKVYIEYGVNVGSNIWKKGRKAHILGKIRALVPVQVRAVPVQVAFYFSVRTSVCILTITCSFLIRFE